MRIGHSVERDHQLRLSRNPSEIFQLEGRGEPNIGGHRGATATTATIL